MKLRVLALGLAVPLALSAQAQSFSGPVLAGFRTLRDKDLLQGDQANPLQPSSFPLPPVKRTGDLPKEGALGPDGGVFQLINADSAENVGPLVHVSGNVEFTVRGYHCWADEVYGDRRTDTYTLKGNVRVLGQDQSIYGETLQINFSLKTFVAEQTESTLKPNAVGGRIKDNLYVKSHRSYGSEREVFGESTTVTTCAYPAPHYEIIAENTDVRPGRRVIFRKAKIKILGRTILNLPYLSIPLDERNYNNLPVVGRGSQEGYFAKTRYSSPLSGNSTLTTRLDYYSRLGVGVGTGVRYNSPLTRGYINLYTIQGPHKEYEIIGSHRQELKWATLSVDSSYEDNNYLISSSSKIFSTRGMLQIPQGKSTDRITFYQTNNTTPGSSSQQRTISVNDNRIWTRKFTTNLDVNFSNNTTSFTGGDPVRREQLDVNFRAIDDLQKLQARLDYIRSIPIGESSHFFTTSDVTPSLTFLSDARRIFGSKFEGKFPFQAQLSYGEYSDPIRNGRLTRADFNLAFQNPRTTIRGKHWDLGYQGEFKQDVYSDNTAAYILNLRTQLVYHFKGDSRFNISYNYLRPYGFTPLQIDRRGNTNNIVSDLSYRAIKNLYLGVATGYDFNLIKQNAPTPWQQVGLQAKYTLGRYFETRAISTYDTTRHAYSSTRFDLTWIPGATYVSIGAKYDGIRNKWAAANLFVDGFKIGRLRTSVLLNYNGYTNHFDAEHYSFIYDLHCAEAVLQIIDNSAGFNSGRQIYFFIRLKALPFDTPFGTGKRGQPIGTGTGRDS